MGRYRQSTAVRVRDTYRRRLKRPWPCEPERETVLSVTLPLLRDLSLQQGANLRFAVAAVAAQGTDGAQLARLRPARNGLRVDAEHRRHLGRGQQGLWLVRTRCHSVTPPYIPINANRGPIRPTRFYGPASPRCPTWSERLIVNGCMEDECPIYHDSG